MVYLYHGRVFFWQASSSSSASCLPILSRSVECWVLFLTMIFCMQEALFLTKGSAGKDGSRWHSQLASSTMLLMSKAKQRARGHSLQLCAQKSVGLFPRKYCKDDEHHFFYFWCLGHMHRPRWATTQWVFILLLCETRNKNHSGGLIIHRSFLLVYKQLPVMLGNSVEAAASRLGKSTSIAQISIAYC